MHLYKNFLIVFHRDRREYFLVLRKKPLYLIATRIVKIKLLHKDFSAKNNIIILLVNEILMNYKMRGIHFYHVKFFWKLCTKQIFCVKIGLDTMNT